MIEVYSSLRSEREKEERLKLRIETNGKHL